MAFTLLLPLGGSPAASDVSGTNDRPQIGPDRSSCEYCALDALLPLRPLTEAGVDSIGRALSGHNGSVWARADSLYRGGKFGPVGTQEAKEAARHYFALRCWNGLDYIAQLADSRGHGYLARESSMSRPFGSTYANTTVYPLRFLVRALAGDGGFCMEYEPPVEFDQPVPLGGVPVRVHTTALRYRDNPPVRSLVVAFHSSVHKAVDLLYEPRFCGKVQQEIVEDRGDTLMMITLRDMEGMYASKAGVHSLTAIVLWRSLVRGDESPEHFRLGACAYFPHIEIRLPFFLPDLGLDDLRDFDVPQPVLRMDWFARFRDDPCDWIEIDPDGVFRPWPSVGPRPAVIEERFPDL